MHRLTAWGMCTRFEDRDGREMQQRWQRDARLRSPQREMRVYNHTVSCACVCVRTMVCTLRIRTPCTLRVHAPCTLTLSASAASLSFRTPSLLSASTVSLSVLTPSLLSLPRPPSLPPSPSLSHPLSPPLQHIKTTRSNTKINKQQKKTYQASSS